MDQIANLLAKIKNAQAVGHENLDTPFSKVKFSLLKILEQENLISNVERKGAKNKERIEIKLKYDHGMPAISGIKRVSRPGQRIYKGFSEIKSIKQGYGLAIISTSQGLKTDKEARKEKLGGEIMCEIW